MNNNNDITFTLAEGTWSIAEVSSGRKVSECFLFGGQDILQYMDEFCQYSSNFNENTKTLTSTSSTNQYSKNLPGYCYEYNGVKKHLQGLIQPKPLEEKRFAYNNNIQMNEVTTNIPKYFGLTGVLEKSNSPIWIKENYYISLTEDNTYIYLRFYDANSSLIKEEKREKSQLLEPYLYFVQNNINSLQFKNLKFSFTGNQDESSSINDSFAYRRTYPYILTRTDGNIINEVKYYQTKNLINKIKAKSFFEYLNSLKTPCFSDRIQKQNISFYFNHDIGKYNLDNENVSFPKFRAVKQINYHNYTGLCETWSKISTIDQSFIKNSFNLSNHCSLILNGFNTSYKFFTIATLKIPSNIDWEYGWFGSGHMGIQKIIGPYLGDNAIGAFVTDNEVSLKVAGKKKEHWNESMGNALFGEDIYNKYGYPHGDRGGSIWHSIAGPQTNNFLSSWNWQEWTPCIFNYSEEYTIWDVDKNGNETVYWSGKVTNKSVTFPRFMSRYHRYNENYEEYIKHQGSMEWINGTSMYEDWTNGSCILENRDGNVKIRWADAGFPTETWNGALDFYVLERGINEFNPKSGEKAMLVDWLWHLKKTS